MAKKSLTLRDFTKGLNTESSPRDVDDQNLTRSVGTTIERPGILRPLGKANSQSGSGAYYSFKDDNDNQVVSSAVQDPGHGLYSFAHSFSHGERSAITKVASDETINSKNTYVKIADSIGTGVDDVNFTAGDIVRIYGKTANKELNNRYFEVKDVSSSYQYVYLRKIQSGSYKEFCLTDEGGRRVAESLIYPLAEIGTSAINSSATQFHVPDNTTGRNMFFKGDYIMIDQEAMLITAIKIDTSTNAFTVERGALGTTAEAHAANSKIYKYTYGPSHSGYGGVEQIEDVVNRDFSGDSNWAQTGGATADEASNKFRVVTTADDTADEGAQLAISFMNGNSDNDYPITKNRKYRIKAKLTHVSGNTDAVYAIRLGNSENRIIKASTTTSNTTGSPFNGTITSSELEYYADVWTSDNTANLLIRILKKGNSEVTTFDIDDVSVKEIDSLAASDATEIEDGYIEIVPQRSFTKYIACQNGETINLFADDTENDRKSTTKWFDRIADLKDDFKGGTSSDGSDLGVGTSEWPSKGIMPTYIFADNALRISPSNKIGKDDSSYSPRWYGHINRNKMFGDDNETTFLNEWYYDTIGVKRPVAQGDTHSTNEQERYNVGVSTDYGKNNILGIPWGNNWFSQMYLTGNRLERQNPAISIMQDINFWEVEEDAAEMMDRRLEVENSDDVHYEISQGHMYRGYSFIRQSSFEDSHWRIRKNIQQRMQSKVTTVTEDGIVYAGTAAQSLQVENNASIIAGSSYMLNIPEHSEAKMIVRAYGPATDGVTFSFDTHQEYLNDGQMTIHEGTEVSHISSSMYSRPNASSDLLSNNGGGGFLGAFTLCQSIGDYNAVKKHGVGGVIPWLGLKSFGDYEIERKKSIVTLTQDDNETPGVYGKTVTQIAISGSAATVTTEYNHGFSVGERVAIQGTSSLNFSPTYGSVAGEFIATVPSDTTFTLENSFFNGKSTEGDTTAAIGTVVYKRKGLPGIVTTKDESLDNTNWVYFNSIESYDYVSQRLESRHVMRNAILPNREYHVTYSCRNFNSYDGGKLIITVGQTNSTWGLNSNPDECHFIDSNAYKTTVVIKSPATIHEDQKTLGICIGPSTWDGKLGEKAADGQSNSRVGSSSGNGFFNNKRRTMIGDLALRHKDRVWNTADGYNKYVWPLTSLAFGWDWTYGIVSDSWGLNAKSYDFYVTYLYDGGGTPQESAPRYLRSKHNIKEGTGLRVSVSLCHSSVGDVYDMFNKRIMGARLYFKATDSTESDKLQALLDVDFVKGVRKSTNATFVPWEEDYQIQLEQSTEHPYDEYSYYKTLPGGLYHQVKPADEGSHESGYFRFDSPPSVLDYETINASQPFEKGDFYAQYKTIALLKGKAYIGNLSILPNGLTSSVNSQSFEYYPNGIIASEEGCYDKFPFETKWVNNPTESDYSPVVKLESYKDNLIVHKVLSTYILNFEKEGDPSLIASLSTSGIKWPCQSIVTSKGVFWANKYGCFHFDGKAVVDITSGKISKNSLGWPNNSTTMYYWDIDADNNTLPSLAYDEVNHQLLVVRNSMRTGFNNSYIWIYDLKSKSWTSDTSDVTSGRFLEAISDTSGYRTNFIAEAGKKVIYLDNRNPNGTEYNFTTWKNKLYTASDASGDVTTADTRPIEVMTKELDFGNPHTQKRIHQIFVTYRMTKAEAGDGGGGEGDIDIEIDYGTDGGTLSGDFETNEDNNYGGSFSDTGGVWKVATLVPSAAIDCYTFQLKISSGASKVNHDFEINDITFVYREKRIRTKVKT